MKQTLPNKEKQAIELTRKYLLSFAESPLGRAIEENQWWLLKEYVREAAYKQALIINGAHSTPSIIDIVARIFNSQYNSWEERDNLRRTYDHMIRARVIECDCINVPITEELLNKVKEFYTEEADVK